MGIRSVLRNLLRGRRKPESGLPRQPGLAGKRPGKVVGHRGVATGLPADQRQPETISGSEVEQFIYKEKVLKVHSSNVESAQYIFDQKKLILTFKNGGVYEYSSVTEQEAINFAQALSKGKWVWSSLRIRGSSTAHQKPWRRIS